MGVSARNQTKVTIASLATRPGNNPQNEYEQTLILAAKQTLEQVNPHLSRRRRQQILQFCSFYLVMPPKGSNNKRTQIWADRINLPLCILFAANLNFQPRMCTSRRYHPSQEFFLNSYQMSFIKYFVSTAVTTLRICSNWYGALAQEFQLQFGFYGTYIHTYKRQPQTSGIEYCLVFPW